MARKKRHKPHEEHASEAWLLPYSDLLTLLLALFIVLFAVSQTDQKKVTEMAQAFSAAFHTGGPSMFDQAGPSLGKSPSIPSEEAKTDKDKDKDYVQEQKQLEDVKKTLDEYIRANGLEKELSTGMMEEGLMIRIKEQALFPSGSAELVADSEKIGPVIANLLATIPQNVIVSGHTDNVPIANSRFPSNWELSSQRAVNFMRFILAQNGSLNPARFSAIGNGEYRPVADNASEEGRSKNRRVEVLVSRMQHSTNMKTIQ